MEYWVIWLIAGAVCVGLELIIPGLVIIFFGAGCFLTACCSLIPFINKAVYLQCILFFGFSIFLLIFLREKCSSVFKGSVFYPEKTGSGFDFAEVIETVSETKEGRIKYKGTTWNAFSASGVIEEGCCVKVLYRKGIICVVEPA